MILLSSQRLFVPFSVRVVVYTFQLLLFDSPWSLGPIERSQLADTQDKRIA
jgi:hypothetical protein